MPFTRKNVFAMMIKMVDRPNTTPIGQGGASQWHNVLFDPRLSEARLRNFCVFVTLSLQFVYYFFRPTLGP